MASASTTLRISITLRCSTNDHHLLVGQPRNRSNVALPLHSSSSRPSSSVLTFSRRRSNSANSAITSSKKKNKSSPKKDTEEDGDIDEDAFEALFQLLEEDLKNDDLSLNDDDISEEDLAKLERELEEALKDDELLGEIALIANEKIESEDEDEDEDEEVVADDDNEDDKDEELPVKLKNWQLKKLGYALRKGRRKTNIKNLAAELCLDRAVVLELLRNPPPNLLLLSDALPDEPVPRMIEPESKPQETVSIEISDVARPVAKVETPVHVMQSSWSAQKRIKKVQLETLEQVYRRSKRPTNAMISSIVHVTNLPRKRVLKWFEDRRSEEGVPDHRRPYQPSSKS
ncbi:PREDICTED: protein OVEREXPRESSOR OF CATIONIC PEROXIDASE 3 [Nicotiana attenuata]|uniref:Protein overexpressor of cationic peroxidase 3 n=1 Tax=Nicotiana attenuata TaxID=49451 RepID=A0A314L1R1_NICAT|nr:PREDICTED: protein OVEREXPRESSOR OF CATIONIC PEROXIDASE 3 [Nicotiana attenuata]XP_019265663.1 PREDICTED: protein OVEREXPRESSOR OF CATIONIC PEROXIDASE 3 [Nicotiana attenuata]XP_019265664.1 PREDICTED: protein OVEREXPRESSOR OF CATIONIC PEROXIDASE 3 [Nicotiana attenuata]XP_019265665.1 PREDICTED: protein OVEREXPRESSOR OF CATIONIC PEROXIDASE 3 [Nicotiana attenuata]XP_019265666.1 PREDICTED: protein OVEREXPRESSOR OF CATIONIC PEROXIDASE 3 [Nicotiana attenuata]OIT35568.1 protein overexpressor of cati